ncbi:LLM class flavin-dependent oxidoreductase [Neorhizobium sp. DAR64860/K0K1]|uniref:LLM class flavin-dependent oxidoreductase n=1 Tax=Neorhizobium sp. DAR64860/K0K1 TaxID=3421955 RepID=UPI003D2C6B24
MKEIRLSAFMMNCMSHLSPGLWRHPSDRSLNYNDPGHWVALAKLLEEGLFDTLFLADVLSVYDVYKGTVDASLRPGAQVPVNDPLPLVPLMAFATRNLGFGLTASVSFEHPFPFARRMSTLDHLTGGRVAWNIVTSYLNSGAPNVTSKSVMSHNERYDMADEYMDVVYKLWEGSWADGAVVRDREAGTFALPELVRPIEHIGKYFNVPGIHLCEPSPQRTPLLFQAGSSPRGRKFAARHAECVFTGCPTIPVLAEVISGIRQELAYENRTVDDVAFFNMATVIVDRSPELARRKFERILSLVDEEASLALLSGATGIDLSGYDRRSPLRYVPTEAGQSVIEVFTTPVQAREWKISELAKWCGVGGRGPVFVGSAAMVADELERWVEATGVDGFNLSYALMPGTYEDIIEHLIPELQRRGRYKKEYRSGTIRNKMLGQGNFLPRHHYGTGFRDLPSVSGKGLDLAR